MGLLADTGVEHVHLLDGKLKGSDEYTAVYLLDTEEPAIIETAFSYSVPYILDGLRELGIAPEDVKHIIPTHVHMDHAGGAGVLAKHCPNAKVYVWERAANYLIDPSHLVRSVERAVGKLFDRYGTMEPIPEDRLRKVRGGEEIKLQHDYTLEIVYASGHAPHQFCPYIQEPNALFTADAVGINRRVLGEPIITTPPPAFMLGDSLETLTRLKALNPRTLLYTHYGAFKAANRIDEYADLLMKWVQEVEDAYDTLKDFEDVQQHFVRKYGPNFQGHYDEVMIEQEISMNTMGVLLYLKKQREG